MRFSTLDETFPPEQRTPEKVFYSPLWLKVGQAYHGILALIRKEWPILTLSCLGFFWATSVSLLLFPYYSNDHDEAVYILQSELLLEGKLYLDADEFSSFFLPFFFINDGDRIFPKYTPVHAGVLALGGLLFGSLRASIGLVAALNIIVFYLFATELYPDRRLAVKASAVLLLSPFFLIQSATFLSYTSSLMFSLTFAFLLLRGVRKGSWLCLAFSGLVLGIGFFHRPYDTLLFAIPFGLVLFKLHWKSLSRFLQIVGYASIGFAPFLVLTLAYNVYVTGDPFLFPFTFHEPLDKLGFGPRRIHPANTPVEFGWLEGLGSMWSNSLQLIGWTFGGPILLGTAVVWLVRSHVHWQEAILLLLLVIYPLGYVFFWGPYNIGEVWGAMSYLGPFYYFPLLVPITLLGTQAVLHFLPQRRQTTVFLILVMVAVDIWLVFDHVSQNYQYTQENQKIYEPFDDQNISNGLIFVPPIYGDFLLHPFAALSNHPSLDRPLIYAIDRREENFLLMDRYPDRQSYRFVYQGEYTEEPNDIFNTELVRLRRISTEELVQWLHITNPTDMPYVYAYVWNNGMTETYLLDNSSNQGFEYQVLWTVTRQGVTLAGPHIGKSPSDINTISETQPLAFAVAFTDTPERDVQIIYERRFSLRLGPDNMMEVIFPPEEWHNPHWPLAKWVRMDINNVIKDVSDPVN